MLPDKISVGPYSVEALCGEGRKFVQQHCKVGKGFFEEIVFASRGISEQFWCTL